MKRRDFLLALAAFAPSTLVWAQRKILRLGYLVPNAPSEYRTATLQAFHDGLKELGYVEGTNLAIEWRYADGKYEQLAKLAEELVQKNVDVIVTSGTPGTRAAKQATTRIPIVMATAGDAVVTGLVSGLARPGGNVTGSTFFSPQLMAKRLELLREVLPRIRRAGVLVNSANPTAVTDVEQLIVRAEAMKIDVPRFEVRGPADFETAFAAMAGKRMEAAVIQEDAMLNSHSRLLAEHAHKRKLPAIGFKEFAEAGGLLGYGADFPAMFRRAAYFIDRIAKGASPADLPVEQANKFELVINTKTGKAMGVAIPRAFLLRADRVIE